jgi:NAD-dependent deacetylase
MTTKLLIKMSTKKNIVVLTGAGISAESGIQTFRDADGLWEGHDVMSVATPEGWRKDTALVLKFYNDRRRQLFTVHPNAAHIALAELEQKHNVTIITQNVDDLHERAGSTRVVHLHGELRKARSVSDIDLIIDCDGDINIGDMASDGKQLRPHIVWFGEDVPLLGLAAQCVHDADIVMVVGSSMQVYPAAGLVSYARANVPVYYVDKKPSINHELSTRKNLEVIAMSATEGVRKVIEKYVIT